MLIFCLAAPLFAWEAEPRELLAQWRQATLRADEGKLKELMHPEVWFSHSNGRLESRAEFLAGLRNKELQYELIEIGEQTYGQTGDSFWQRGPMKVRVKRPTGTNTYELNVLHVWVKSDGRWQMRARQSTRVIP
jgi:hypothetical protein